MLIRLVHFASSLHRRRIPLAPSAVARLVRFVYGCEISYLATIHRTVSFPHKGLGVVIGDEASIGAGSRILQNVTIGGRSGLAGGPMLGEGVLVGAGACLLGPISIGDAATIGANAVVLQDVPAGYVAVGVPARLIAPERAARTPT